MRWRAVHVCIVCGLTVPALTISSHPAEAQQLLVGGFVGMTVSDFDGHFVGGTFGPDWTAATGFTAGGAAEFRPIPYVGLRLEAAYVQKGATEEDGTFGIHLDYIEMPLLVTAGAQFASRVGVRLAVGMSLGVQVGCQLTVSAPVELIERPCISDQPGVTDLVVQDADWSFVSGIAVELRVGRGIATVDMRYAIGLKEVAPDGSGSMKNRSLWIRAGYVFAWL